jgi:hypothetical protein
MQLSREMSTLRRNCYLPGQKLYRRTDPHPDSQIYKSDKLNAGTFHTEGGPALSHRCVYPTQRPDSHTGVSTQHTGPALSHRRLPNTAAGHYHTGVSTQHTGPALSHRCVYPTQRPGTVTPVCLPKTAAGHCHTGVSTQHSDRTVTPVCLPNTPGRHCHTGVSTQHIYLTTKAINVFIQLLNVSTPPVIISHTTKGKYEQLNIIMTPVSRSDRNMLSLS